MAERTSALRSAGTLFGWLLLVIGAAWTVLAGGGVLAAVFVSISSTRKGGVGGLDMLGLSLLLGAIGSAPGLLMLWLGLSWVRGR
jgi:hypothetical protein